MGLLQPNLPVVDHDVWDHQSRRDRMRPLARHYAEHGFGSPDVVILLYALKVVAFAALGWALILSTPGIDGWTDPAAWFRRPEAFAKAALFTMLWEVLGLGCGFGPLNGRFLPPLGTFLYWLRPRTVRLPPFGGRVPLTGGDERRPVDVALYAAFLVATAWALWGPLSRAEVAVVLALLVVVGLRDQVIFLAARGEVYGPLALTFLFADGDRLVAAKLALLVVWWGAAVSKLNRHFPFVLATMLANSPFWRVGGLKRRLWRDVPDDLRPGPLAAAIAHGATLVELVAPAVLLVVTDGPVQVVAAAALVAFHLGILSSFPMGVPLEWNVFMIWGAITLDLGHPGLPLGDVAHPAAVLAVPVAMAAVGVVGNLVPSRGSFLPAMRYYAGNWATTTWCFRGDAADRLADGIVKAGLLPHRQLVAVYGDEQQAAVPLTMGQVFRGFHAHGRAIWSLVPRACGGDHEERLVLDGELVAAAVLGWNFGDGHLHDERLVEALQRRCGFGPGDLRVVVLESQPAGSPDQAYRLGDAATGCIERGTVAVADLTARQPTDVDVPATVTWSRADGGYER